MSVREVYQKIKCPRCGTVDGDLSVMGIDGRMVKIECHDDFHPERVVIGGRMATLVFGKGGIRDRIRGGVK